MAIPSASRASSLAATPLIVSFGTVNVGSTLSKSIQFKNTGTTSVTVSGSTLSGSGFKMCKFSFPFNLGPGASLNCAVSFTPTSTGSKFGTLSLVSNASNGTLTVALAGTGEMTTAISYLTATPMIVSFGTTAVGSTLSNSVHFSNTGASTATISAATVSGVGFKMCTLHFPFNLSPGASLNCAVSFTPTSTGSKFGTLSLASNASDGTLGVALSGTGATTTKVLSASATSLNFGDVTVGKTASLPVTLTSTGNSDVTISGVTASGSNISTTGGVSGATLAAGQTATIDVWFSPTLAGTVNGKVLVSSNATDSIISISVAAVGVSSGHSVFLHWTPSSSPGVIGYYVYRALSPSTTYTRISSSPVGSTSYADDSVSAGAIYRYEVSAVNSAGMESNRTGPITAIVP